jgi:stearoyl-CoA desaturase (delta-9 desaturase)
MKSNEQPAVPETLLPKRFDWVNAAFITLTPIAAVTATLLYVHYSGFHWGDLVSFAIMYALTGTAITAGYHRYYSHRTYEAHPLVQIAMLIFGAAAVQNSLMSWVSDHRYHHRHTDQEQDPYNIKNGFFWAHIGWIYFKPATKRSFDNIRDLKQDPLVRWQHRYYVPLAMIVGLGLPFLIGLYFGRPWGGVLWGGFLRCVAVHHSTFLINSAAHVFGERPHSEATSARDSWWLPFLTFGEGYHNFHHSYPGDYRNGVAWYHWDTTKWLIAALSVPGWTWNLRRTVLKKPALGVAG